MNRLAGIMILIIIGTQQSYAQTKIFKGKLGKHDVEMHLLFEKVGTFGYFFFVGDSDMQQLHSAEGKRNKLVLQDELDGPYINISITGNTISGNGEGGISCWSASSVISHNIIDNNTNANGAGGGGILLEGSSATITYNIISNEVPVKGIAGTDSLRCVRRSANPSYCLL